jgi:hypothetical protein
MLCRNGDEGQRRSKRYSNHSYRYLSGTERRSGMLLLIDGICEADSLPMIETVGTKATIQYVKSAPALNMDNFGLAYNTFRQETTS